MSIVVRPLEPQWLPQALEIWNQIIEDGNAFPETDLLPLSQAEDYFAHKAHVGVALHDSQVAGLYALKPNSYGRCGHIANASYAVHPAHRGGGVGEALVQNSIEQAAQLGFQLLQFNAVVCSNKAAIHLYEKLGFQRVGQIPGGFHMKNGAYSDMLIYYYKLT